MNVHRVRVSDLDLDESCVATIGEVLLSLVIAHTYLKSSTDFKGVELSTDAISALGMEALLSADEAHAQLHDALFSIRSSAAPEWVAESLVEVVGEIAHGIDGIARQMAVLHQLNPAPDSRITDEAIAEFLVGPNAADLRPAEDPDSKIVRVQIVKPDDDQ